MCFAVQCVGLFSIPSDCQQRQQSGEESSGLVPRCWRLQKHIRRFLAGLTSAPGLGTLLALQPTSLPNQVRVHISDPDWHKEGRVMEKSWEKEATRSWLWGAQVESEHFEGGSRGIRVQGYPQLHCQFQASCEKRSQKDKDINKDKPKVLGFPIVQDRKTGSAWSVASHYAVPCGHCPQSSHLAELNLWPFDFKTQPETVTLSVWTPERHRILAEMATTSLVYLSSFRGSLPQK